MKIQPLVTKSLAKQISENIRDAILVGELKVDDRLPTEEELAARYEVSRPTIREALKRLAAQGLVRSKRGPAGGTFIDRPSQEAMRSSLTGAATLMVSLGEFDLEQIAEARQEMEVVCVKLAAKRRDEADLVRMAEEIATQKRNALSDEDFCASDVRFHRALVDAAKNPMLQFVMFAVIEALQPVMNMVIYRFRNRDQVVEQHQRIFDALSAGDSISAAEALLDQMACLREQYAQAQAWRQEREMGDKAV